MKNALLIPVLAAAALVVAVAITAGAIGGSGATSIGSTASTTCPLSGPVPGLDIEQATNANAVVAAAMSAAGEQTRVARVAVMVALTESGLRDLDNGDKDSLGLFQQRPNATWGTAAQLMDPTYATDAFVTRLVAVPDWTALPPWLAAQAVRGSSFADGSNYRPNWTPAGRILVAVLDNADQPGGCQQGNGAVTGPSGAHGLPAGYTVPAGTPPGHAAVVGFALDQLGKPYVWAAAGPGAYDCSGLTMAAWATVGVQLEHYTGDQQTEGVAINATELVPGDLVLVPGSDSPGSGLAGHVGLYLGDELVLSAIDPAEGVAVQTWAAFVGGGLDALRDPDPGL